MQTNFTYEPIPKAYFEAVENPGRLDKVVYEYGGHTKHAYVYVPSGYDAAKPYEIMYMLHGGGGNAERFAGSDEKANPFKYVLDNMIAKGDIPPMLMVFPSYYTVEETDRGVGRSGQVVAVFPKEMREAVIPAVESRYHTYAADTTPAGLTASRKHRGFGGFSMGSVTTWYMFAECMDLIGIYLPMSGDSWACGEKGGNEFAGETAAALAESVAKNGYTGADFRILAATGTKDIAFPQLDPQLDAMSKLTDVFQAGGNLRYLLAQDMEHTYDAIFDYTYDALRVLYNE